MATRDELIEAGTQAVCDWDPDYDPADEDTRAAVGVVIDAVEPLIRADERERLAGPATDDTPLWQRALIEAYRADLRAKVEALPRDAHARHDDLITRRQVLALFDGSSE